MAKKAYNKRTIKKWLIIIGCVLLIAIIFLAIPRSTYQKWFGKSDVIVDPIDVDKPYCIVYVKNDKEQLVGLKVKVDALEEDEIKQKWDLLTSKVNSYQSGYYSPIETSAVLENYEIVDNVLVLNVTSDISLSDGKEAVASLAWTFCNNEIKELVLKVDDVVLTNIGEYEFTKIDKSITVNYVFETSYLYESEHTTIIFYETDYILPVTYFYKGIEEGEFIVCKLLDENLIVNDAYSYELSTDSFTINMAYDGVIEGDSLKEISDTVKYNLEVASLVINNNIMKVYEESFINSTDPITTE